ncbi:MAG TPA: hypothetical protein VKQ28_02755 [Candidatus Acidoferrum sp.]|nr:hypothetical protein [Candidatus Acidoferrum sp.]
MKNLLGRCSLSLALAVAVAGSALAQAHTTVSVRLNHALSTGSAQNGDNFTATLESPLLVNDRIVAEKGARVTGQVREVVSSGRLRRPAAIMLTLKTVETPSRRYPMQTNDLSIKADSHAKSNLLIIGGLMGAGAAFGGTAGGGRGALIGAAAGAGTGTTVAYLTGKREIVLPAETLLTFHINSVSINPKELSRLQRSEYPDPGGASQPYTETRSVVVVRPQYDDDEDDDGGEYESEHESYRGEYPRNVEVVFLGHRRADVVIYWQGQTERLTLDGDNLEDILSPLCERTHVSVELLRSRIRIRQEHDDD